MAALIIFGTLTLVLVLILGGLLSMQIQDNAETDLASMCITFCIAVCICLYLNENHRYYEKKEYPSTEYNINKKIVISDENNVDKIDTLYYFTKKIK